MVKIASLASLFLCLSMLPALAAVPAPFQIVYRQENIVSDRFNTRSDLMITVINLSGGEARDIILSIPALNPFLYVDSPVSVPTIPNGRQAEILKHTDMPHDLIALSEPEETIVWRLEYTDEAGERVSVEIQGLNGE